MSEFHSFELDDGNDTGKPDQPKAVLTAGVWLLSGFVLAAVLGLATGVVSWPDPAHEQQTEAADHQLWTCGMHPEVIQEEPGICPICHMDLTPLQAGGSGNETAGQTHHAEPEVQLWTCPMHPMIEETEPGSCPICGMDLVPVKGIVTGANDDGHGLGTIVTIDPSAAQKMNVRVAPVERHDLSRSIRTVGHLEYDQEHLISVTTRIEGFVERVFVNLIGERVKRGQPLFEVYSPELVQTQQELLSAIRYARRMNAADAEMKRRADSLVASARQRLSYWDMTDDDIKRIEASGAIMRTVSVVSPINGVIIERLDGLEGMAIRPGLQAMRVADLSSLWLVAEIYEQQLPWLHKGSAAVITFDALPGEQFTAHVRSVDAEVSPDTRTVQLTLEVANRDRRLRVGMYATVVFEPVIARDAVVVPAQALIRSGQRDIVVVALGDGRFAPQEVTIGAQTDGFVQILQGLDGSESIVTSAQFLIDSESNLRAAVDAMIAAKLAHRHE